MLKKLSFVLLLIDFIIFHESGSRRKEKGEKAEGIYFDGIEALVMVN